MHTNDAPLHGLTQEEVRARLERGRTNTMPRRAEGGLADILRRNVLTLFNLLNLCWRACFCGWAATATCCFWAWCCPIR